MSIDVHNHVIPTEALDLFSADPSFGVAISGGMWNGVHHVPFLIQDSFCDPVAKLTCLDNSKIDIAIVSPPPPLFFYEVSTKDAERLCQVCNEGMAKFCGHRPERLRWLANLPMQDADRAAAIYRSAAAAGAVGAAVGTSVAGRRLDTAEFEPFWRAVDELALPVLIHPAFNEEHSALDEYYLQNVIGNLLETTVTVERLICAGVLGRHRRARLVLTHGGGYVPYQVGRLAHACGVRPEIKVTADEVWEVFSQLYFDTVTHDVAALRYLVQRVGRDHVVLGTDMPFDMALPRPVGMLMEALQGDDLAAVAETNASRLFGL